MSPDRSAVDALDRHLASRRQTLLDDFRELLRIPSVSTDPERAGDVTRAAHWVASRMARAGLEPRVVETEGHPLVLGRHEAGPEAPTVLVYAHYDVQPADPLEAWSSPPFEPETRDGILYARGAADDKAQVILQIAAAEACLAQGGLPVNLILLFEGEEEVGSPALSRFLGREADALATDHVIIADSMMFAPERPSLIFGTRGLAYTEITVRTGRHDLHSGQYGGAVPNPAHLLARVLASLHDDQGRVAVEGFYDRVVPLEPELREAWRELGYDEEAFRRSAGGAPLAGEGGYSTPERLWARPCLDVNGMVSGYTGPGKKTVLPHEARAKVSCRLVLDQDPERIAGLLRDHVRSQVPAGVEVEVEGHQANRPWRADPSGPLYRAAGGALREVWGVEPARVAHGGTLPIAREMADRLTESIAVVGFALPGANMHAPDEWIPEEQVVKGARAMARLWRRLGG